MNIISNILYWISTGLLVPVIVLLIFFFARALMLIGTFFGQYLSMKKTTATLTNGIKNLTPENLQAFAASLPEVAPSEIATALQRVIAEKNNPARIDLTVSEYELAADKNLATSKTLTKMGPILGLMGTLIPMGPALVGLATGDIASMAYNMQVAFATTVVGLVVSAIGFLTQQVKERWFVQNLTILEFVADIARQASSEQIPNKNQSAI